MSKKDRSRPLGRKQKPSKQAVEHIERIRKRVEANQARANEERMGRNLQKLINRRGRG